jgi:hypothetical protein
MRNRYLAITGALAGAGAAISLAAVSIAGQTAPAGKAPAPAKAAAAQKAAPAAAKPAPAPRTPWGQPDLQGTWFVMESVPLERSAANANREFLTDEEVAARDKANAVNPGRNARSENANQDVTGAYNAVFNSILKTSKRTSMIIDPPDGKIPPTVQEGQGGRGGRGGGGGGRGGGRGAGSPNDNPETVAQSPRCLGVQAPFLPLNTTFAQGTVLQIVQSPKSVGIYLEDDHAGGGNRVILIDNKPFLPSDVRTYLGDSRARWEGDTLVVETRNFTQGFRGSNPESFRMIERYRRVDAKTLRREVTFDDPKTWTRPWTVMIEMGRAEDNRHMIFDSACHEGNYGMTGILIGSRMEEKEAKK